MSSRKENKRSQRRVSTSQIDEENEKWLENVTSGNYQKYYQTQYTTTSK